jgi:hypothetical protein
MGSSNLRLLVYNSQDFGFSAKFGPSKEDLTQKSPPVLMGFLLLTNTFQPPITLSAGLSSDLSRYNYFQTRASLPTFDLNYRTSYTIAFWTRCTGGVCRSFGTQFEKTGVPILFSLEPVPETAFFESEWETGEQVPKRKIQGITARRLTIKIFKNTLPTPLRALPTSLLCEIHVFCKPMRPVSTQSRSIRRCVPTSTLAP